MVRIHAPEPRAVKESPWRKLLPLLGACVVGGCCTQPPREPYFQKTPARCEKTSDCPEGMACNPLLSTKKKGICEMPLLLPLIHDIGPTICGCDGKTYYNWEEAYFSGVATSHVAGKCEREAGECKPLREHCEGQTTTALPRDYWPEARKCEFAQKNPQACMSMAGRFARAENGAPYDPIRALQYYRMACDRGLKAACMAGGLFSLEFGEPSYAANYFRDACRLRVAAGCAALAKVHETGKVKPPWREPDEAAKARQKACELERKYCEETGAADSR